MANSFIEIDGGRLAFEVEGDGPLVVCSHGVGDTRASFDPLAADLMKRGFRVARFDLRGHGESSVGFRRYGDEAIADDFLTVIGALGGTPAVLAGNSMSGGAAVIAAGRQPSSVAGLVLLGPFLRNTTSEPVRKMMGALFMKPWGPMVWKKYATGLWPALGAKAAERAAATVALLTRQGRWAAFRATFAGADHRKVAPWINRVQAPVLVVMGDADPDWKDPLAEARWIASCFGNVRTVIVPGAGHAPMLEDPDVVSPAVAEFLQSAWASGPIRA